MDRKIGIPLFICSVAIGIFVWVASIISALWLFVPATVITFLVYLGTFYKKMPSPDRILPVYLLALGVQMLHFAEEYVTGFVVELPALLGQNPYGEEYWLVFNMAAYSFFIMGAIVLFKQITELSIIPLFFIIVGVVLNAIAHFGIAVYTMAYIPGLYTAVVYLIIGPFIIKAILPDPTEQAKIPQSTKGILGKKKKKANKKT